MLAPTFLGFSESFLQARGGLWTAREIVQQPEMLRETQKILMAHRCAIEAFLEPLLARPDIRVILTGAGTSAFIGDSLAPCLATKLHRRVEAIATTDLISAPDLYFAKDVPTLLVSFGRSGNSPESVAAVEIAQRCVDDLYNLVITCNADGALAKAATAPSGLTILLPEPTHDRSFAMTSSYSCMVYAGLVALSGIAAFETKIGAIAAAVEQAIGDYTDILKEACEAGYERVAYLGSHIFKGTAREAALKMMELTNGAVATLFDSPVGVRHGPKTFVNGKTLVVLFMSNDPYTRQYDVDMLNEFRNDHVAGRVIALTAQNGLAGDLIRIHGLEKADDTALLFPYIVVPQIFAFQQSLHHGLTPDKPNPNGTVHRVVQGVHIHERA
jgi:tagatose-6-phosphate ketose/aldose isomerase